MGITVITGGEMGNKKKERKRERKSERERQTNRQIQYESKNEWGRFGCDDKKKIQHMVAQVLQLSLIELTPTHIIFSFSHRFCRTFFLYH